MTNKIRHILKYAGLSAALLTIAPVAHAETCVLDDAYWMQPRSGITALNETAIRPCVLALLADNKSRMQIIYNDTDESGIAADELRQWLVALALPAERIILKKATTLTDPIRLEIQHD
ncbi:MAG: hypothetical protein P4L77_03340 [Sulfuriferula sp.]|nr:hypothetical protein [Sulfuriferula sp.]